MHVKITGRIELAGEEIFVEVEGDEGQYEEQASNTYDRIRKKLTPKAEIKKEED